MVKRASGHGGLGLTGVSDQELYTHTKVQENIMSKWKKTSEQMPGDTVVLIHVKSLGKHGVVAAWWYTGGCAEPCWVVLNELVTYKLDRVDYWRDMVELPEEEGAS